ncbi:MAG: hypothetical protein Q4F34_07120 [Prevotellaceae bacterium]|nr:hypothetical protein [Prevotellaceae bacterium]
MEDTGRCPYCGSEDVEEYSNGICECNECGAKWRA